MVIFSAAKLRSSDDCMRRVLAQQAVLLHKEEDRLVALKRVVSTMQVLLARSIVIRALSLLSVRY